MSDDAVRPEVIAAGTEVLIAAVNYVDGRNNQLPTIAMVPLYQRLERAVTAFQDVTDG